MEQYTFQLGFALLLLVLGFFFGRYFEKEHYRSIIKREAEYGDIIAVSVKTLSEQQQRQQGALVTGNVVISVDYFKRFLAMLRTIFGGRVIAYETLLDRARREAVLRMKEQARAVNAAMIFNIKFETASISKNAAGNIGSVEVLVYGTAIFSSQS